MVARYVRAFEDADLDALVALFHEEMRTTMPPIPTWVSGGAANKRFYRAMFGCSEPGVLPDHLSARERPARTGIRSARLTRRSCSHILVAIERITTRDGAVSAVDHFMLPEILPLFAVPREIPSH